MPQPNRRQFLQSALLSAGTFPLLPPCARARAVASTGLRLGDPAAFSFEGLAARAQALSKTPYEPPYRPAPGLVQQIDYDAHGKLRFRRDHALFGEQGAYPVTFFSLGKLFPNSVRMHQVQDGESREILYCPSYFDMPARSVARKLPEDAGFAGFRLHESVARDDWETQDWVAFLGASYFRTIGALGQYGLSARGIAVNTTAGGVEEFPSFTEFYLERAANPDAPVRIHALLDGPSITGAYRFDCTRRSGVGMEVDAQLFLRQDVEQLGVAPLTSMFWYAEHDRPRRVDWRPEVHDSDALTIWTGRGERLVRPLNNPARVITSSFVDRNPKGFGLVQRDRNADHYLDGVNYESRPTLWVEPLGKWGRGQVQLVEIPTDDETNDNIAAFWRPEGEVKAGAELRYRYRLHWDAAEPGRPSHIAQVVATRIGRGGQPGQPRPEYATKFVVEFAGEAVERLPDGKLPTAVVQTSRGKVVDADVERVPHTRRVRAQFDLHVRGGESVELRMHLRHGQRALSETWLYQFQPRASA